MKHQGIEGFTWDSKAEEWAAWCASVSEHDPVKGQKASIAFSKMFRQYVREYALEAMERHHPTPANQWSDPDPYRVISWRDYPPSGVNLWAPTVALILAAVFYAWAEGYL